MEGRTIDHTLSEILERTGYLKMLRDDPDPDAESRLGNLEELLNAARDASERGETVNEFLDHAALVAQADALDAKAAITLMTMHNAKGLEFPVVFVAGMEEGLFPHSRARDSVEMMEEERRLCYVAITRAEKRLHLSSARYRRRYGGGAPEATIPSRFLEEIPPQYLDKLKPGMYRETVIPQVNLMAEQSYVRESVKKTTYTGKTYNSVENIAQFFRERGGQGPASAPAAPAPPQVAPVVSPPQAASVASPPQAATVSPPPQPARVVPIRRPEPAPPPPPRFEPAVPPKAAPARTAGKPKALRSGLRVTHPKYGKGTLLRVEGDGEDARLTISFATAGLKKMVAKYAGIQVDE
jgi:DNA helicase-2/ATP-dependent DNA helicase PcrA